MNNVEQVNKATIPNEMRAEIQRLRGYDSLVSNVMDMADYQGLSGEDRYTLMAYHALSQRQVLVRENLNHAMVVPRSVIIKTNKG